MKLKNPSEVKEAIALLGYSQNKFANEIGVTSGYVSQVLNEERYPSPVVAFKIANGIGKKVDDIFFAVPARKSKTQQPS